MKTRFHQPDYLLIFILGLIIFVGLLFLSSSSSVVAYQKFKDSFFFLKHQLFYGLLPGLIIFFVLSKIDYHFYKKIAIPLFFLTLLFLLAVFFPGLGISHAGAKRWIYLRNFTFQPSEIAKLILIVYLAAWCNTYRCKIGTWKTGVLPFIFLVGSVALIVVFQSDLSTALIIFGIGIVIYFLAGGRWLAILSIFLSAFILSLIGIKIAPYRMARVITFFQPQLDPQGTGYHIRQALIAVGSGGIFGRGFGHSYQKFLYLPEVFSDSIFAIIAEEGGFLFSIGLIFLFVFLTYRGFRIAKKAPDLFGQLLAGGISSWFILQTILNIGAIIGIFPLTGIPLPLVSYGGTSMISFLAAFGILTNISRQTI